MTPYPSGLLFGTRFDRQTIAVILLAPLFGMWRSTWGTPLFFDRHLSPLMGIPPGGLGGYAYLCITEGIVGFVIPVFILVVVFRRRWSEIGLGLGEVKFALKVFAASLPLVTVGCWFLSRQGVFQNTYPLFRAAADHKELFVLYEFFFLIYLIGWEYLWRGFLLFGTSPTFGAYSVFIQMLPFAAFHSAKPVPEAYLSIGGGLLLGMLVWRCRSFWIAVPLHASQLFAMDFFCTWHR